MIKHMAINTLWNTTLWLSFFSVSWNSYVSKYRELKFEIQRIGGRRFDVRGKKGRKSKLHQWASMLHERIRHDSYKTLHAIDSSDSRENVTPQLQNYLTFPVGNILQNDSELWMLKSDLSLFEEILEYVQ